MPAPSSNGNNAIDSMGKSLDALSLSPPAASLAGAQDHSYPSLGEKTWFYGAITRAECDNLLNQYGQDGDFLVRSSETNVRAFPRALKQHCSINYSFTTRWEITQFRSRLPGVTSISAFTLKAHYT